MVAEFERNAPRLYTRLAFIENIYIYIYYIVSLKRS